MQHLFYLCSLLWVMSSKRVGMHYNPPSPQLVDEAMRRLNQGMSFRKVAEDLGISRTTLMNKCKGKHSSRTGRPLRSTYPCVLCGSPSICGMPKIQFYKEKWINSCPQLAQWINDEDKCICSKHFENQYFYRRGELRKNAVPTIFHQGNTSAVPTTSNASASIEDNIWNWAENSLTEYSQPSAAYDKPIIKCEIKEEQSDLVLPGISYDKSIELNQNLDEAETQKSLPDARSTHQPRTRREYPWMEPWKESPFTHSWCKACHSEFKTYRVRDHMKSKRHTKFEQIWRMGGPSRTSIEDVSPLEKSEKINETNASDSDGAYRLLGLSDKKIIKPNGKMCKKKPQLKCTAPCLKPPEVTPGSVVKRNCKYIEIDNVNQRVNDILKKVPEVHHNNNTLNGLKSKYLIVTPRSSQPDLMTSSDDKISSTKTPAQGIQLNLMEGLLTVEYSSLLSLFCNCRYCNSILDPCNVTVTKHYVANHTHSINIDWMCTECGRNGTWNSLNGNIDNGRLKYQSKDTMAPKSSLPEHSRGLSVRAAYIKGKHWNPRLARSHQVPEEYVCNICGVQHHNKRELDEHIMFIHVAHNHVKYTCDICQLTFRKRSFLSAHIKVHFPTSFSSVVKIKKTEDNPTFVCQFCDKTLPSESQLDEHKTSHFTNEEKNDLWSEFLKRIA